MNKSLPRQIKVLDLPIPRSDRIGSKHARARKAARESHPRNVYHIRSSKRVVKEKHPTESVFASHTTSKGVPTPQPASHARRDCICAPSASENTA